MRSEVRIEMEYEDGNKVLSHHTFDNDLLYQLKKVLISPSLSNIKDEHHIEVNCAFPKGVVVISGGVDGQGSAKFKLVKSNRQLRVYLKSFSIK